MLVAESPRSRTPLVGTPTPRIAPPLPARHLLGELEECAADLGLTLMEWQRIAGRYLTALGPEDRWLFRRFAAIVSRQNGKTEIIKPRVLLGFKKGRRMLHIAQDRARPRKSTFKPLVEFFAAESNKRKYGVKKIREANGQEEIECLNGSTYTIAAPTSGGARGDSFDDIFIDEVREFEDYTIDGIIRPTVTARPNYQLMYFSNAGHAGSVVLNDIRKRRDDDPRLAYLEWSAPPELDRMDPRAWAAANPALGTTIEIETLADFAATMQSADFDTEHLCRWVISMRERLVRPEDWAEQEFAEKIPAPRQTRMGVKMDISGERASAVVAWLLPDGRVATSVVADVTGSPVDADRLGPELVKKAAEWRASEMGFDPYTDAELARHFRKAKAIVGRDYATASRDFERTVKQRQFVVHDPDGVIGADLEYTARHTYPNETWIAVKADDEHTNTAAEAAIRAIGLLLAKPQPIERSRIF